MSAWTNFQLWWRGLVAAANCRRRQRRDYRIRGGRDRSHAFQSAVRIAFDAGDCRGQRADVRDYRRRGVFEAVAAAEVR